MNSCIYNGVVTHKRFKPVKHFLKYKTFSFFIDLDEIEKANIIKKINFTHPYFNKETLKLQNSLQSLQGKKRTWYCGAYFGYGFHEDGLKSSINLIENFKI